MKTISTILILLLGVYTSFGQVAETIRSAAGKAPIMLPSTGATNGAVWVLTNAVTGEGELKVYPKIVAYASVANSIAHNGNAAFPYNTVEYQYGGLWDGTNWTPQVVGYIRLDASGAWKNNNLTTAAIGVRFFIKENATVVYYGVWHSGNTFALAYPYPATHVSFEKYCSSVTNRYTIWVDNSCGMAITNFTDSFYCRFSGEVVP